VVIVTEGIFLSIIKITMRFLKIIIIVLFTAGNAICSQSERLSEQDRTISLAQAIEIALKNNRTLQKTALHVSSTELLVKAQQSEFTVKVKPVTRVGYHTLSEEYFSGGLELSMKNSLGMSGSVTPEIQNTGDNYRSSVDISLNIPLLKGFGQDYTLDALNSSLYDLENSKRSFYQQQVNIVLDTVSTVYKIIKSQQQIQLLSNQIDLLQHHLSITRIKEKKRLSSSMDLYRAEIRLKDVQNELTVINEQLKNQNDKLKDLLAMPLQSHLSVEALVDYKPVETKLSEAIDIALENRIEIEQSQRFIEESKRKFIIAKKNVWPRLDLKLGYEKYGDNKSFDLDKEIVTFSLNSSPDLLRLDDKRALEQARIRLKQSQLDLVSEKQKVSREVRSQVYHMRKIQKLISDRKQQSRQAQGKLELASSKFNHGLADNFNLLEAQSQAQRVRSDLLLDTIDYIVSMYRLRAQLGTLIDRGVKK